eukprot:TRINITY_DN2033_c0_g1_i1.p1 TRINITY_DN2033_c0_g1~~TRINITY_DN2033_c0_g1_i1.p1  ORF type:complete len:688 (-),score=225.79 TRINITY_DN2033_c0_g1_i1:92-2086(-)
MAACVAMIVALLCSGFVHASGLSFDVAEAKKRPTTKVVELLKGMQEQLESEAKQDEKTYENFKCWCTKNTEEKSKSVKAAQRALKEKQLRADELVSKSQRLKGEIEASEDEMSAKGADLHKQSALRAQEHKEYADDKVRLVGDLKGVDSAQAALTGDATGFLQKSGAQSSQAASLVQQLLSKHAQRFSSRDRETLDAFVEDPTGGSSQVSGILQGMHIDFANDLAQIEADEAKRLAAFNQLTKAIEEEIEAARTQVENKHSEMVDAREEAANLKWAIKDITESIGDDAAFEDEVKKQCADMDAEWDKRSATRAEESEAISKAIETLNSEDAHDTFYKSTATSFLQQSMGSAQRQLAAEVLDKASRFDTRLSSLARQTKIDKFTKVKKAMDDMVAALKKEQQDEVEQKEYCVKSLRENDIASGDAIHDKEQLVAKEGTLKVKVEEKTQDIAVLGSEIAEAKTQLVQASQNREEENTEFQRIVAEQRETQRLLKQALKVLGNFYNKKQSLAQVSSHDQQPKAPQGFKDYKANGQSAGVMGMLQQLISDSERQEAEAKTAEAHAQKAYESFAKDTTTSVDAKEAEVADLKAGKAKEEKAEVQTRQSREGTDHDLTALKNTKEELHDNCDSLMSNFDARQAARSEEMDSVEKAKAILSGATFAEIQLN